MHLPPKSQSSFTPSCSLHPSPLFINMKFFRCLIPSCCHFTGAVDDHGPSGSQVADFSPEPQKEEIENCEDSIQLFNPSETNSIITDSTNSRVIGEGGFSTVYLAKLPGSASRMAAFKVHDQSSERLYRMFRQELDVLLRVNHPNIVRLLGYSDDGDQAGVLIFEHVPNGTLHDMVQGKTVLSWAQRMSIACQLAMAVDFLHEGCDLQIIHGDIKASNVLLDQSLNPKLCDFGFARMGFSATVARSANPVMGSPGYVDPQYLRTGLVSKKSDVYSFGVLILELVSGMEAFDSEKSQMLTNVMRPRLQSRAVGEMVDHRLGGEYDEGEVATMVEIAARCIGENPSLRPSMGEVLRIMREEVPSAISAVNCMSSSGKKNI